MTTFALDVNSSEGDIIAGLNYALANLGNNPSIYGTGNVLVANITTGEITTTSSNSGGYTDTTIVSYLYRYMQVKYANSATGSSGFTSNSTQAQYFGLRNTSNVTISNNPADYVWYQVTGGFGTTKSLWYATIGGRQIATFAGTAAPQVNYVSVPDMPFANSAPIDLDSITAAAGNQVVVTNAYLRANSQPATPTGGFYDFATFTLYPPVGWAANVPPGNDPVYISQAAFSGQTTSNVAPQTTWSYPNILSSNFAGNTGPQGERGPIPMAYVLTSTDPTSYSDAQYTSAFSASRTNSVPPIGVGYTPLTGDTSQFLYANLINPNNSITIVKTFDANTIPQWQTVRGNVISGNLFVTGTVTSSALNTNDIYTINTQSTNANIGNTASAGYWFQANTGDARLAGNVSIGNFLTVGQNATIGANLNVGTNANIGNNLNVGANAYIGNNITIANVITFGVLNSNVVGSTQIAPDSITTGKIAAGAITGNTIQAGTITGNLIAVNTITGNLIQANTITGNLIAANTIQGSSIVAGSITANELAANAIVVGNITSIGATFDNLNSPGYWLNNVSGNVRFGGNTSIGNNLTVGTNATIGGNLTINGLLNDGALVPNVVATTNLIQNAVNQTVTAVENSGSNLLSFNEGAIAYPNNFSYWPPGTRGYAITANLTPQSNTSTIIVNFSTYVNSTANAASNLVELWRSGNSNIALTTFNSLTTLWPTSNIAPTATDAPYMYMVGNQGQGYFSNDGGVTWTIGQSSAGTSNFVTVAGAYGNVLFPNLQPSATTIYRNAAWFNRANTGPFYTGNAAVTNAGYFWNNAAGDISSSVLAQSTYSQAPVFVGVNPTTGNSYVYAYDLVSGSQVKDISYPNNAITGGGNFVSPINSVAIDILPRSTLWNTAAAALTPVRLVVVGNSKQIAFRDNVQITSTHGTTFGNLTSTLNTAGGWNSTTVAAPTSGTPDPTFYDVESNATVSTRANTWVAVGTNYYQASPQRSHTGIWTCITGTNLLPTTWSQASMSPTVTGNIKWVGVSYGNGYWVTVSNVGNVAYSNNGTSWTFVANTPATQLNRVVNDISYNPSSQRFVIAGNSLVMTATVGNLAAWNSTNVATRSTGLTRLQYYGSWYDPWRTDVPLPTQQLVNGSVVSGTSIDNYGHDTTTPITYYLVVGNLSKLQANAGNFVYISNPTITITEQKR